MTNIPEVSQVLSDYVIICDLRLPTSYEAFDLNLRENRDAVRDGVNELFKGKTLVRPRYTVHTDKMSRKPTISGRVPESLEERFTEYSERHDISKSEALRQLLESGLDDDEKMGGVGPLTQTEKWCRNQFGGWAAATLLSGSATAGLFVVFILMTQFFAVDAQSTIGLIFGFILLVAILVFVMGLALSVVLGIALKTGFARTVDKEWLKPDDNEEASA